MSHQCDEDGHGPFLNHTWECDGRDCKATFEEYGTYTQAWNMAKAAGWRCWQQGRSWVHYCGDCVAKGARKP